MLSHRSLTDRQGDFDQRSGYGLSPYALSECVEPESGTGCRQKVTVKEGRTWQKTPFCKSVCPQIVLNTVHGSGQITDHLQGRNRKGREKGTSADCKWSRLCLEQVKRSRTCQLEREAEVDVIPVCTTGNDWFLAVFYKV